MRLSIPFPQGWQLREEPSGWTWAIAPGSDVWELAITVSPVRPIPALDDGFLASELGALLDDARQVHVDGAGEERSQRGWPVSLVRGAILDPTGTLVERRLAAIYRLLDRFATVLLICRDAERWSTEVGPLGEVVLAGELDWSGPPSSLAEILLGPVGKG